MKVSVPALVLLVIATLTGCGFNVATSTSPSADPARTTAVAANGAAPSGHEIATMFAKEKAGAAPAEMYPSF